MSSEADLQYISERFLQEILNNINTVKNKLQEHLTHNFIPVYYNKLLGEKRRAGIDDKCDKFHAGIKCTYSACRIFGQTVYAWKISPVSHGHLKVNNQNVMKYKPIQFLNS